MRDWSGFVKESQVWGYYAPAHGSPSDELNGAKAVAKGIGKGVASVAGSVVGGVTGAFKQYSDAVGRGALPAPDMGRSWVDIAADPSGAARDTANAAAAAEQVLEGARIGANVGWSEGSRTANDMATTGAMVASDFGLMSDDAVLRMRRENDKRIIDQARRYKVDVPKDPPRDENGLLVPTNDPEYATYDSFVSGARHGQLAGRLALDVYAGAKGTKALRSAGQAIDNVIGGARNTYARLGASMPATAQAYKDVQRGAERIRNDFTSGASPQTTVDQYNRDLLATSELDPSTPEYRMRYEWLDQNKNLNPEGFSRLPAPTGYDGSQGDASQSAAEGQGASQPQNSRWNGWKMSPEMQNLLGYGLGGALLGGLFGGRGSWWKWALLSAIIGHISQSGGSGNLGALFDRAKTQWKEWTKRLPEASD